MSDSIQKDLDELLSQNVITDDEAIRIRNYYDQKPKPENNRLVIVFGILGSLLVGMGLVLIIAHNWDTLPKIVKLSVALLPLLIGQSFCGYLLWKQSASVTWRESASVFVVFAIAVSISIVSQVYNIQGDLGSFLLAWMLLTLPVIYVMRSSAASLLFWIGITAYACEASYFSSNEYTLSLYWLLALTAFPWYWQLTKHKGNSNFTVFHHWIIACSVFITLGTFAHQAEELILPAYLFLSGVFVLTGQLSFISKKNLFSNAYLITGSLGMVSILLMLSFDWYWNELQVFDRKDWLLSTEFFACCALLLLAIGQFMRLMKNNRMAELLSKSYVIPVFLVLFALGLLSAQLAQILTNIFILVLAVYTIREGAKADHLGRMNYGLMILSLLIVCRFFDTNLSFVIRGLLFVMVGLGFFGMNYRMVKKRRERTV